MTDLIRRFIHEDEGQDLAEYALLVALIALIVMAAVTIFGTALNTFFGELATEVNGW